MNAARAAVLLAAAMLLQWWWSAHLAYWGAAPQFLFALTVLIAARRGPVPAMLIGWMWGLYADVLRADLFGADALLYMLAGYVAGQFRSQVDLEATGPLAATVFLLSWAYFLLRGALGSIFAKSFLWAGWIPALATPLLNALAAAVAAELWDTRRAR